MQNRRERQDSGKAILHVFGKLLPRVKDRGGEIGMVGTVGVEFRLDGDALVGFVGSVELGTGVDLDGGKVRKDFHGAAAHLEGAGVLAGDDKAVIQVFAHLSHLGKIKLAVTGEHLAGGDELVIDLKMAGGIDPQLCIQNALLPAQIEVRMDGGGVDGGAVGLAAEVDPQSGAHHGIGEGHFQGAGITVVAVRGDDGKADCAVRENFRIVREKLADLKEKDYKRLLQPCIDGNEIMEMFHLKPGIEVGALKQCLKDAVLDNQVPNEREALMGLLKKKAAQMGLSSD